tara:strand:- start:397 stop:816 length:420 start_codon:yes stop_codon:yes gene_type:complete
MNTNTQSALNKLSETNLKVTNQRKNLIKLIFANGDAHHTAEDIFKKANKNSLQVSLATVYNTLNSLTDIGMLKAIRTTGDKIYFDTNLKEHFHFYCENSGNLTDINTSNIEISNMPELPTGKKIRSIDVVINIKDKNLE